MTVSKDGKSSYLNCEFEILEGSFKKRKFFDAFGITGNEDFVNIGQSRIRAIVEAIRGIDPQDKSAEAMEKRKIGSYEDLEGAIFLVKIGVRKDKSGQYNDKNNVDKIIGPANEDILNANKTDLSSIEF